MIQRRKIIDMLVFTCAPVVAASRGHAANDGTIFGYNLGLTYDGTASHAEISYDTPTTKTVPEDCVVNSQREGVLRCTAYLGPSGSSSPSFGIYLQAPFKRQGFLYFDYGATFSTVNYKGYLISKPSTGLGAHQNTARTPSGASSGASGPSGPSGPAASTDQSGEQPLTKAYLEFYGVNWQGYLQFGITPHYFPDLLISFGGGVQTAGGRVKIFTETYTRYVIQPDVFATGEAVIARMGTGSLSIYVSQDQSFVSQIGTNLVDDNPSGTSLTNIRLGLSSSTSGLKLLFPF